MGKINLVDGPRRFFYYPCQSNLKLIKHNEEATVWALVQIRSKKIIQKDSLNILYASFTQHLTISSFKRCYTWNKYPKKNDRKYNNICILHLTFREHIWASMTCFCYHQHLKTIVVLCNHSPPWRPCNVSKNSVLSLESVHENWQALPSTLSCAL